MIFKFSKVLTSISFTDIFTILIGLFIITSTSRGMVISEVMPAPLEGDEWIELYNESDTIVNLNSWQIIDAAGNGGEICSSDIELLPYNFLVLLKNPNTMEHLNLKPDVQVLTLLEWTSLNNDGDRITLFDSGGETVDIIEYGSEAGKVKGRSWERIDPKADGINRSNWGPCADLNRHTAGRANSLQKVSTGAGTKVKAEPNPFNPYLGENASILFEIPAVKSRVTVDIFDSAGRKVRKLASNIPAGSQNPLLSWNGCDDDGRLLPIGRYIILLQAVDVGSGTVHSSKCTVVLAGRLR